MTLEEQLQKSIEWVDLKKQNEQAQSAPSLLAALKAECDDMETRLARMRVLIALLENGPDGAVRESLISDREPILSAERDQREGQDR